METLGKMERISDLRQIWKHEALDFSKWLAEEENLSLLSETIGIEIRLEELEASVGNFFVDIFAKEEGTGRKIIIENQLEETNHDHLGKIITYASGKSAEVVIWIVKYARDEHRQAMEWLNQHTDENIGFFLVEIELWKIGSSPLAPKFNVVVRPNDWGKNVKMQESLSETQKLRLEFWQKFADYASEKEGFLKELRLTKPQPNNWFNFSALSSVCFLGLTTNMQTDELTAYIYYRNNKDALVTYKKNVGEIQAQLDCTIEFSEGVKDGKMIVTRKGVVNHKTEQWGEFFHWYCEMALKLKTVVETYGSFS